MKKWLIAQNPVEQIPEGLAEKLAISPFLLSLLWRRGLRTFAEIDSFLDPLLSKLTPPYKWPQIPQAAKLLVDQLLANHNLTIWGDYDVDGVTATALCLDVLDAHNIKANYHLPDRTTEGYGLNIPYIERLAAEGCDLLLTVDCGIANVEAVARAKELGMTVIISDHHLPPAKLPPADAICNPRMGTASPCSDLAGVGVAFFLMAAVDGLLRSIKHSQHDPNDVLDLVVLGTLADIMPLRGENRTLVRGGLKHLAGTQYKLRPGLAALKEVCGYEPNTILNSGQVSFQLAPRLNAAGRMENADLALQLLRVQSPDEAKELAQKLDQKNTNRREEEEKIFLAAKEEAHKQLKTRANCPAFVIHGADWHPGIIGIVASKIMELFYRPTIILCNDSGLFKGSGRSIQEFNLYEGLKEVADCLVTYGGHSVAAGLSLKPERLQEFTTRFLGVVEKKLGGTVPLPTLKIEQELGFADASNLDYIKELNKLQPFGAGNPEPVFASPPLLVQEQRYFGQNDKHLLLQLQDVQTGISMRGKVWNQGKEFAKDALKNQLIKIAYTLRLDAYNGLESPSIEIKDIHILAKGNQP